MRQRDPRQINLLGDHALLRTFVRLAEAEPTTLVLRLCTRHRAEYVRRVLEPLLSEQPVSRPIERLDGLRHGRLIERRRHGILPQCPTFSAILLAWSPSD